MVAKIAVLCLVLMLLIFGSLWVAFMLSELQYRLNRRNRERMSWRK